MKFFHLIILYSLLIFLFSSCLTDNGIYPKNKKKYVRLMDSISIGCTPDSTSNNYLSAKINGKEFCKYAKEEGDFSLVTFTSTLDPNTNQKKTKTNVMLDLGNPNSHLQEYFTVFFPDINNNQSISEYFDSLLVQQKHTILGTNVIFEKLDNTSLIDRIFPSNKNNSFSDFMITLNLTDTTEIFGKQNFGVTSTFGNQKDSYIKFNKLEKLNDLSSNYCLIDIEFKCNLYYKPTHGKTGLWGEVKEGNLIAKVKINNLDQFSTGKGK